MIVRFIVALFTLCLVVGCSKDDAARKRLKGYILDKEPKIEKRLNVDFDGKLELLGYKFNTKSPKPDKKVKLTLYWKVKQKLDEDMRLTTHVLDGSGERIVSLDDRGPLREKKGGKRALPLSAWEPGKIYVDEQPFKFPSKVKTGRFQIVAGVYKGNERVAIKSGPKDAQNRVVVVNMPFSRSSEAKAKAAKLPSVRVGKLDAKAKIKLDGKLDEPEWETAARVGPFVDVATGQPNKTFPVNGRAKLLWSEQNLYVAFEVEDKDVVGGFPKTAKDPHLWTKDTVEIMVEPDGEDNKDYYEIQVGPQNLVFDSQFDKYNEPKTEPDGPFGHQDWSSGLKSAVVVDGTLDKPGDEDKGYVVEMAIPWKSFSKAKQIPPKHGDNWRMNFYAMQENSGVAWSPILGQGNFHKAARFGKVIFVDPAAIPDGGADAGTTDGGGAPASSASAAPSPSPLGAAARKAATAPAAPAASAP
jgi:hypothetical protein